MSENSTANSIKSGNQGATETPPSPDREQAYAKATSSYEKLKRDQAELVAKIFAGLRALVPAGPQGQVAELRAFEHNPRYPRPRGSNGYFDDLEAMARAAAEATSRQHCTAVYYTVNPINPDLLARRRNRMAAMAQEEGSSDQDIVCRFWLFVDLDPVRVSGVSSTDSEHSAALDRASALRLFLNKQGWPEPVQGDSGNGSHLFYRIDLPHDASSGLLIRRVLEGLASKFSDGAVKVDCSTHTASHLGRVFGTWNRKGDSTSDRPHRQSQLLDVPEKFEPVAVEKLQAVAELAPITVGKQTSPNGNVALDASAISLAHGSDFEKNRARLEAMLSENGIENKGPNAHGIGGLIWKLRICPFDEHSDQFTAYVGVAESGAFFAHCFKDGCGGTGGPNRWSDLKRKYSGWFRRRDNARPRPRRKTKREFERTTGSEESAPSIETVVGTSTAPSSTSQDRPEGSTVVATQNPSGSPAVRRRPRIVIQEGGLPLCVTQGEQALLDDHDGDPIYQRGSLLIRAVRVPVPTVRRGFRGAQGALLLRPVTVPYLIERFTIAAEWVRVKTVGYEISEERVDCPTLVAQTYLAREGHWKVPVLLGVIEAPTLRPDGSILATPGYDPATCLLFDPGSTAFEPIPEQPTLDDARAALDELLEILKGFAWVAPSDRSAALAAILTALIRRSIRTAPLFGFRAPTMASGKSLMADIVSMISTGRVCSVMSQGKDEDEERKRILAILIEGEPVACIDNIERPLGGADLCSVLTQEYYKGRLLGKSEMVQAPTAITLLATGNNLVFIGDIVTRVVPCDLDPRCERPEERRFDVNLHEYVPAHRGRLVRAALTILRAFHVAGRPSQDLSVFGRFEEWSEWVRSAIVWCGEADPCDGRKRLSESDPVGRQLRAVLSSWTSVFGSRVVAVAEVIRSSTTTERMLRTTSGTRLSKSHAARMGSPTHADWASGSRPTSGGQWTVFESSGPASVRGSCSGKSWR